MKSLTDKVLVLGVDGMDPRVAKHFMDEGKMPNLKKYVEMGSAREDLMLLGGHPTVTPPMWTTMATGAHPMTHGITDYHNQSPEDLEAIIYAFDSRMCKAELLWDVLAEAGKKTLVFHWPGSSWPPTSDSPNLHVVDGLSPGGIGMGGGVVDDETIFVAAEQVKEITFRKGLHASATGAGCIIEGLELQDSDNHLDAVAMGHRVVNIELHYLDGDEGVEEIQLNYGNSPLKAAEGWANAPADAKEFYLLVNGGLTRRPSLLLKNAQGVYDHIEVYEKKNQEKLLVKLAMGQCCNDYVDVGYKGDKQHFVNRNMTIIECAEDGSYIKMWISRGMDINMDSNFHPRSLHDEITKHAGEIPAIPTLGGFKADNLEKAMLPGWSNYTHWQNRALKYLLDEHKYDVVFSHIHNIDICAHVFYRVSVERAGHPEIEFERYPGFIQSLYEDTDRYLGEFLPYMDQGYTIMILSDHGGVIPDEDRPPLLGDPLGVNAKIMHELGYTGLKKDAEGNLLKEIDWSTTTAIATRALYIWINLKGRNKHGIVDEADKYELERKIIDDLYNYRDPATGKRVISIAVRRKEAVFFGLDSDECGDIIYFIDEGFNRAHGDGLSTVQGMLHTSVSPIFIAAGPGIKKGYTVERVLPQLDIAPTIAALTGVRMPAQCEGAPMYQILDGATGVLI